MNTNYIIQGEVNVESGRGGAAYLISRLSDYVNSFHLHTYSTVK
jgi:hypothetical protein